MVLLHGWPGDHTDYTMVVAALDNQADVVVPDLRGFGESGGGGTEEVGQYGAAGQARSVAGLIEELGLSRPVVTGYDVGSRVAQALAVARPELVSALVVTPPLPGIGRRVLSPQAQREFWYQSFHQLRLAEELLDGNRGAVRAYLAHFWNHWSGPRFTVDAGRLDHLADMYAVPGAFTASIRWYRAGAGTVATAVAEQEDAPISVALPTRVLWPEHDALFPRAWADHLERYFADLRVRLVNDVGHFAPVECTDVLVEEITAALMPQ